MKVAILGGGESGAGAAYLAKKKQYDCFLSDGGKMADKYKNELEELGVDFEEGQHSFDKLKQADIVVKSPGIPGSAPIVQQLKEAGKEVVSEIEWAFRHSDAKWIAITGTNGKTTTTALCAHVLKGTYKEVEAVGNIGTSASRYLADRNPEWVVCEVSSFQLEDVRDFHPYLATILNITPDHLDRYADMEAYANAKFNISSAMRSDDHFYFIGDDFLDVQMERQKVRADVHRLDPAKAGNGWVEIEGERWRYDNPALKGRHNGENVLVVVQMALRIGMRRDLILERIESFVNHPHRMEVVGQIDGVTYVNDSKATNVEASSKALGSYDGNIIWIVGGKDKGNDYSMVDDLVTTKVKKIIALGADNGPVLKAFGGQGLVVKSTDSMEEALESARKIAEEGDVVLLSPACASFDLYKNYEERGDHFRSIVNSWNI
jgi:UDP-N-acetylmuramoylalanine--D-glutamate ligase